MEKKIDTKSELKSWLLSFVFAFAFVFICKQFLFSPVVVDGKSMEPTYKDDDVIIVSKISKIKHFDQVVFKSPIENAYYIKRVIGLPGDSVEVKDDILYINGKKYEEPYVNRSEDVSEFGHYTEDFTLEELTGEKTVPENHLFVLGDNRLYSKDSRHFGFISYDAILGESKIRIFPFKHIKLF